MNLVKEILMGVKRSTKTQERVDQRMAKGVCLVDGCACVHRTRGLCGNHYMAFNRSLWNLPYDERIAKEMQEVRAGRVLARDEIRKYPEAVKAS